MKNVKEQKAITLLALVVAVVILLILTGVTASIIYNSNLIGNAENAVTDYSYNQERSQEILGMIGTSIEALNYAEDNDYNIDKGVNNPKLDTGMIPIKYGLKEGTENEYGWIICREDDKDWYYYEKTNMKWANVMLSDGTYKGATAVPGTFVEEADLGSMFVWIPRYAYSINEYKTEINKTEGTTQNIMDVSFLVGKTCQDAYGNVYNRDYDASKVAVGAKTPKIVHPAFTFGGEELSGIWVAKFEASMAETNNNTAENNNVANKTIKVLPNADIWRYIQIGNMFKTCLNMKNNNIYGLTGTDSHLMKNNEWGAVAYIAASQYGVIPARNTSGSSYTENNTAKIHSYTGQGNYKNYVTQSTTGNVYGVYDLNGGGDEYIAAYWDNEDDSLARYGTSDIFPSNKLKTEYEKYFDKYKVGEMEVDSTLKRNLWSSTAEKFTYKGIEYDTNYLRKQITEERVNLFKDIKGNALAEVLKDWSYFGKINKTGSYNWIRDINTGTAQYGLSYYNGDRTLIGHIDLPFLRRGGSWSNGTYTGVFTSNGSYGESYGYYSFRPTLVVL